MAVKLSGLGPSEIIAALLQALANAGSNGPAIIQHGMKIVADEQDAYNEAQAIFKLLGVNPLPARAIHEAVQIDGDWFVSSGAPGSEPVALSPESHQHLQTVVGRFGGLGDGTLLKLLLQLTQLAASNPLVMQVLQAIIDQWLHPKPAPAPAAV